MVEPEDALLEQLKSFGFNEHGCRKALIATKNGGIDQAFEYLGLHENDPGFNDPPTMPKRRRPRYIPLELQRLFAQMQSLDQRAISTEGTLIKSSLVGWLFWLYSMANTFTDLPNFPTHVCIDLTTRGFQWQGADGRVQHDAHELNRLVILQDLVRSSSFIVRYSWFVSVLWTPALSHCFVCIYCATCWFATQLLYFRLLIDALERSLKHTTGEQLCQDLYRGHLVNQIHCLTCNNISERGEQYYDLNIQVRFWSLTTTSTAMMIQETQCLGI